VSYTDKTLNGAVKQQSTPEVTITGEVDRVYKSIPQNTTSVVAAGKPRFDIVRDNLADTVVWNPWREKAAAMADFEPKSGYKNMLCVEVGAVSGWQQLDSGERWEGGQLMKSLR
jgi:glucose-6-phosphate 1-epimerase